MITANNATLAIQAGGQSRRMGSDKSLLPFLGKPLIQRVSQRGALFCASQLITANDPEKYRFLNLPVYPDAVSGAGPLAGLLSALQHSATPFVAVVGCDMPFLSSELLAFELQTLVENDYDAVIPRSTNGLEPLHALYRRATCLDAVQAALSLGNLRLIGWLKDVKSYDLPPALQQPYDPQGLAFINVNSPEEFQQAEQLAVQFGQ